ncbi:MAG: DNRLRE domain-containing protein [Anaerolineae bacterium]|nr:DNRLRE domain-containing protein [Anaerolineae bacterium]
MQTRKILAIVTLVATLTLLLATSFTLASPQGRLTTVKLIFIHHSCGENWLGDGDGGLGIALRDNNYFVSDTNYEWGPDNIGDNTDIGHWWDWFRGTSSATYLSALYAESDQHSWYSRLPTDPGGENEIIMFKSCYPNSYLGGNPGDPPTTGSNPLRGEDCWSDYHTVANAKGIYNDILEYFETRQDKLFVAITAPPVQDDTYADNARAFNTWLVEDWLDGYPYNNVAVFDFYNVLTSNGGNWYTNDLDWDTGNHHRYRSGTIEYITDQGGNTAAYPDGGSDDHPSQAGNQKATAEFVQLLNVFYNRWAGGTTTPTPTATGAPSTATSTATATATSTLPPSTATATATATPTPTGTPPTGEQTMTFQDGVSPDASYAGTTDVILANDEDNVAPNANLGGLENLETFFGEGEEHRRSLMRWDLSALRQAQDAALSGDVTIISATVELYRYDGSAENAMQIALYRVMRDWTEGTGQDFWPDPSYVPDGATWTLASPGTAWTTPGGDFDAAIVGQITLPVGMGNGWVSLDATAAVRAWIEAGLPNYGLLLRPLNGDYTYHYHYSRNHDTPNLRPRLVVTYTVGGTATPTPTPTATPTNPPCDLDGDLDGDGDVDIADIMLVASIWHTAEGDPDYNPAYDLDGNGVIDIVDIMLVAIHWGETCTTPTPTPTPTATTTPTPTATSTAVIPSGLIQPADLVYEGAFAYPSGDEWAYSGHALAYYPEGDPTGPIGSYPGSLYIAAHAWYDLVGEITIPEPVISDNFDDLPKASVLRSLTDITEGWKDNCTYNDDCLYREVDGLEYLPNINKIVWNLRDWYNVAGHDQDSLGWSELDMTGAQGVWHIGERGNDVFHNAKTCNYLFQAPESFASENLDGKWLIAGNHREAGALGGSQGPTLYALAPWEDGNPPESGQNLDALALLYYPEIYDCVWEDPDVCHFPDYRAMDNWGGGAWVQTANRSGILIFGRKGLGDNCYGTQEECGGDPCVASKGYHAYPYEPQILFYDPGELKEVIAGTREPWEVLPYEVYSPVNEVIDQECAILGAVAYDQERGLIYVTEQVAGPWGETVVHVWEVQGDI